MVLLNISFTYEALEFIGLSESKISANPTIISPSMARPHPTKCLSFISISFIKWENINVVTILAPFNIIKDEPDIMARAVHWSITENRSLTAGIINIVFEWDLFYVYTG